MQSLTKRSFTAVIWSAAGNFTSQFVSFGVGLLVARILKPEEYGLIAMALIFTSISAIFIDGGFSTALIRKKDPDNEDISTVFFFNIGMAVLMYAVFFVLAPYIASFFDQPELIWIIRIITLSFILNSLGAVQDILLVKSLNFKAQSIIRIVSVSFGGLVGLLMAILNYGVWALVGQTVVQNCAWLISLWIYSKWKPKFLFSIKSFKELFGFGSKLMLSSFINNIFTQIYAVVIGRFFPSAQLGFYNRADNYHKILSQTLTNTVNSVAFPSMANMQDDDNRLREGYRRIMKMTMLLNLPLMGGLILIAHPMILLLLTEKWINIVPYLQWLCLAGILYPLHVINLNIINIKGRSDLFLILEIVKKAMVVLAILIGYQWGVIGLVIGQVALSFIGFYINGFFTGKFIQYSVWQQVKDIIPLILATFIMIAVAYLSGYFIENIALKLAIECVVSFITYYIIIVSIKVDAYFELKNLILGLFVKKQPVS